MFLRIRVYNYIEGETHLINCNREYEIFYIVDNVHSDKCGIDSVLVL